MAHGPHRTRRTGRVRAGVTGLAVGDAKGWGRQGKAGRTARRDGPAGPWVRTGAMRVCSILVETRNIPRPVS